MIITITLNPAVDKTIYTKNFTIGCRNIIFKERMDAGGKGINASKVICSFGGTSIATGFLGGSNGDFIYRELKRWRISSQFVRIKDQTRMNVKLIDIDRKTNTDLNQTGPFINNQEFKSLLTLLGSLVKKNDKIIISGSLPRGIGAIEYKKLILQCIKQGGIVFLDAAPKELSYGLEVNPMKLFMIKPNLSELERLMNMKLNTKEEIINSGRILIDKGVKNILVSLGAEGSIFMNHEEIYIIHPIDIEYQSATGAGDALLAGYVYGKDQNKSEEECLRFAASCAAAAVQSEGNLPGSKKLVDQLIDKIIIEKY